MFRTGRREGGMDGWRKKARWGKERRERHREREREREWEREKEREM